MRRVSNGDIPRRCSASTSRTMLAVAESAYVQPIPRCPPAESSTSTSVVFFHSAVPSDSGVSVGTSQAETAISAISAIALLQHRGDGRLDGLADHVLALRVAAGHGLREGL